ncbi:MAG: hypothetical protein WAK26_06640 [Terracidiphilus sp.]
MALVQYPQFTATAWAVRPGRRYVLGSMHVVGANLSGKPRKHDELGLAQTAKNAEDARWKMCSDMDFPVVLRIAYADYSPRADGRRSQDERRKAGE